MLLATSCVENGIQHLKLEMLFLESVSCGINAEKDKKENGEAPQRRTTITEKRQGDANDWSQSQHHSNIDENVEKKDAHHTIAVDSSECIGLPFSQMDEAEDESQKQKKDYCTSEKAFFFAHCAENKISFLLGHKFQFRLCAVEESFPF